MEELSIIEAEKIINTPSEVDLILIRTHKLIPFIQRMFPKVNMYGDDDGEDALKFINALQNKKFCIEIAHKLNKLGYALKAAEEKNIKEFNKLCNLRFDAEKKLLEEAKLLLNRLNEETKKQI